MKANEYLTKTKKYVLIRYKNQSRNSDTLYIVSTGGHSVEMNSEVVVSSQTSGYCFATVISNPFELDQSKALGSSYGSKGQLYQYYSFDALQNFEGCVICSFHNEDLRDYHETIVSVINDKLNKIKNEIERTKTQINNMASEIKQTKLLITDYLDEMIKPKSISKELSSLLDQLKTQEHYNDKLKSHLTELEEQQQIYS